MWFVLTLYVWSVPWCCDALQLDSDVASVAVRVATVSLLSSRSASFAAARHAASANCTLDPEIVSDTANEHVKVEVSRASTRDSLSPDW